MPITYTISRDERLIKAYATGVIRADDLHPFLDALLADPDLRPGLRGLYDADGCARLPLGAEEKAAENRFLQGRKVA